ncbi:MAG: YqaA family protein [Thermoguttaceae bacterium]
MKFLRSIYNWVLSWADTPYGTPALAAISFMESSFFPIPPDVLQIALSAAKPKRAYLYATVSLIASVLGALLGYYIGYALWETVGDFFLKYIFSKDAFEFVKAKYEGNAFLAIIIAAFTPIPYKVFTIAAGVFEIPLKTLIIASLIGRGLRFYLVATLIWLFGARIKVWIDKYFELCTILFTVLLIGGILIVKVLLKH